MEFVEGESLDKRIEQGPLQLTEALDAARQVANALEAAHAKKIVHRDIKPGNVIVDAKAHVTVMDFGLALLTEDSKLTALDTTLGTAAYMSPEQIQGMEVDHRTDIWALGCVLYEMVCGQRPFKGLYDKALLYEIVQEEYEPITGVRADVPMDLEWITGKCLAKAREERYQTTTELIVDVATLGKKLESGGPTILRTTTPVRPAIDGASSRHSPSGALDERDTTHEALSRPVSSDSVASETAPKSTTGRATTRERLSWLFSAAVLILLVALSFVHFRETPPTQPLRRFSFTPESLATSLFRSYGLHGHASISPDGEHIVYLAGKEERALYVKDMDRAQPRKLEGTEGAMGRGLFWSPDSRFIGFVTGNEIKKVAVAGGSVISLCPITDYRFFGASWRPDGSAVVFSHGVPPRVFEVSDQGGEPELLFEPEITETGPGNFFPLYLPGKRRVILFSVGTVSNREVVVRDLETGDFTVLVSGAYPIYSSTGHILYQTNVKEGGLWALPFAIETLKPAGNPFRIAENVTDASLSADGALVAVDFMGMGKRQLVWLDREGRNLGTIGQPQEAMLWPALSPNGRRVAVEAQEGGYKNIWLHDTDRPIKTRLTFDPTGDSQPVWSVSGEEVFFASTRRGVFDGFSRSADGSGEARPLPATPQPEMPRSFSSDGKYLLYSRHETRTGSDIWYLKRKEQGSGFDPRPLLQGPFNELKPRLSPDDRYFVYHSDESGRPEIYVQRFPDGGGKSQVSNNGGLQPYWSKNGNELFYVEDDTLITIKVSTGERFSASSSQRLFRHPGLRGSERTYDVSADGQRFVVIEDVEDENAKSPAIHIIQNWYEEFRGLEQD